MKPTFLQLEGSTTEDRHKAVQISKEAILSSGGFVTDFHQYSNISVCINFEISFSSLPKLGKILIATSFLHEESVAKLDELISSTGPSKDSDVIGTLNLTFLHDQPDLRIEAPPIPG